MNRLKCLFGKKKSDILSVYFTAGYPSPDIFEDTITALVSRGIDMIEIGVPFSDPMADGPTIQESSAKALEAGMTLELLLSKVANVRDKAGDTPFVLMGYLNPMLCYGIEKLFKRCKEVGIDALIIPDLPFAEYESVYKKLCREYEIPMIMLITPATSDERIRLIDHNCDGFIYMVSAAATTGTRERFESQQIEYFKRVNAMGLEHERLIGFGISNPETLNQAMSYSSGAIIGSLFIKCLKASPDNPTEAVDNLLKTLGR
ncbi:MAG: tryptophan synthase subunit alpha [Muribaculaceae bacterium]|nr:tryptophan synthase subunit alpha [Muribaculaceae bacterium]